MLHPAKGFLQQDGGDGGDVPADATASGLYRISTKNFESAMTLSHRYDHNGDRTASGTHCERYNVPDKHPVHLIKRRAYTHTHFAEVARRLIIRGFVPAHYLRHLFYPVITL